MATKFFTLSVLPLLFLAHQVTAQTGHQDLAWSMLEAATNMVAFCGTPVPEARSNAFACAVQVAGTTVPEKLNQCLTTWNANPVACNPAVIDQAVNCMAMADAGATAQFEAEFTKGVQRYTNVAEGAQNAQNRATMIAEFAQCNAMLAASN